MGTRQINQGQKVVHLFVLSSRCRVIQFGFSDIGSGLDKLHTQKLLLKNIAWRIKGS